LLDKGERRFLPTPKGKGLRAAQTMKERAMFSTIGPPPGMFTPHGTFSPTQLILPMIVLVPALAFWGWMFRDMLNNNNLPNGAKNGWVFAFILLNIFAAAIYYIQEYRHRR
jgi:hypothetical protein